MAAIGILGGMGPQASAHLQTLLVRNAPQHFSIQSDTDFPEIVHLSVPVPNFITNKEHMEQAKNMLVSRVALLEQAGCVVNGIACNTAHLLLPELQQTTTVPFISIPQLVAAKVQRAGFGRVGLLATPTTLGSMLYDEAMPDNVTLIQPSTEVAKQLEVLIFKKLRGELTAADRQVLHSIVTAFTARERLDAVILGCTELPLVFGSSNNPKVINTLQELSHGLLSAFAAATGRQDMVSKPISSTL